LRILDNGLVEITGKKTGRKKIIHPKDLPAFGISYSTYQTESKAYKEAIGGETKELSAANQKQRGLGKSGLDSLNEVKNIYQKDPKVLLKQKVPGKWLSRKFDSALFNTVESILRSRSGAAVPEEEVRRYMTKLGPTFGDNRKTVEYKLNQLENIIENETGTVTEKKESALAEAKKHARNIGGTIGGVLGGVGGFIAGGPPGAGLGAAAGYGAGYAGQEVVEDLLGKQQQTVPEQVIGQVGGSIKAGLTGRMAAQLPFTAGKFALGAERLVGKGIAKRAVNKTSRELAKKEILEEGLKTASKGHDVRDIAIAKAQRVGEKVNGNIVYKSIKEWAKKAKRGANTATKRAVDDFLKSAGKAYKGKMLNPETAKSIWDFARKSHTSAGRAGLTIESTYHGAVRDGIRVALEKTAPGFEKGTKLIAKGLEREKVLKTIRTALERQYTKKELAKLDPLLAKIFKAIKGPLKTAGTYRILGKLGL